MSPLRLAVAARNRRSRPGRGAALDLTIFQGQVAASADDAHQFLDDGSVNNTSEQNAIGHSTTDNREVVTGVRFQGVTLAQGEHIQFARLRFVSRWYNFGDLAVIVRAHASDDAPAFTAATNNISERALTTASVPWVIPTWYSDQDDANTRSPDLSAIVQEIVNRAGWAPGNNIAFVISLDPGVDNAVRRRFFYAFAGQPERAALAEVNTSEPTPPPPPPPETLERDGDAAFDINNLDDTVTYEGATLRTWYQRLLNSLDIAFAESEFNKDSWTEWNRVGRGVVNVYLMVFRVTGDLRLLDECARLFEIAWGNRNASGVWTNADIPLEWNNAAGLLGVLMYTLERNRALESPLYGAGGYGTLADKYWPWLENTYIPHVRPSGGSGLPLRTPNSAGGQHHAYCQLASFHWYMGRTLDLRGGTLSGSDADAWKDASRAMLTDLVSLHATGVTPYNDRTVRLYNHMSVAWGSTTTGQVVQYTTYHSGEVSFYLDMRREGMDDRISTTFIEQLANAFSDLVCDDAMNNDPLARTLAGDRIHGEEILGLTVNMTFRGRVNKTRTVRSVFPLLAPYDSKDHIRPYLWAYYPNSGTVEAPEYPHWAASAIWILAAAP